MLITPVWGPKSRHTNWLNTNQQDIHQLGTNHRCKNIWRLQEDFARGCEIHQFRKVCEIPSWLAKISQGVVKFLLGQFTSLQIFRKGLWISWMLDSFSDSLPFILDWFGKGFEAIPNLDSSCNLASILLCHGLYQVLPHSWLVLMIEKLSKTSKLAKN